MNKTIYINNNNTFEEQWKALEPLLNKHISEFFSDPKNGAQAADSEKINVIKNTAIQLLKIRSAYKANNHQLLELAKVFLKFKIESKHGNLTAFFESLNKSLGGVFPLREVNRLVKPLKCVLKSSMSGKTLEEEANSKIKTPISISELRSQPELIKKLDGDELAYELARFQNFAQFKKVWGGSPKKSNPSKRIVDGMMKVNAAIGDLQKEIRSKINSATDGFLDEFETVYKSKKWVKVPESYHGLLNPSKAKKKSPVCKKNNCLVPQSAPIQTVAGTGNSAGDNLEADLFSKSART
jgi:hypothetical protein